MPAIRTLATALLAMFFAGHAGAVGLQNFRLGPIAPAPGKITIDGKLDAWRAVTGYTYNPLGSVTSSGGDPLIEGLLEDPVSVNFKTCYDADALYVALEWTDRNAGTNRTPAEDAAHWSGGGEGFALHLLTDRVLHLACWPAADGKGLSVMARYDDETAWKDVSKLVEAVSVPTADGKGCAQELRIPWTAISSSGKAPADGKVELGADFEWNAIPATSLPQIRKALATGFIPAGGAVPVSFLTSRPGLVSAGYLANVADWGQLVFGGTAAGDFAIRSPEGNMSLEVLPVPVKNAPPGPFQMAGCLRAFWESRFVCRVAAQYDSDKLFLVAHFSSFQPMTNRMPESTQQGFNGGDALQIRLSDGTRKVNLCGWYDSQGQKAALTADGRDLPSPFLLQQGAQETFRADADGHGYVQELAIPWKLLFGDTPKDGSLLKGTMQFWFADVTPLFSLYCKTTLQRQGALPVSYKMPQDGQLTLGLYDSDGRLLRWLAQDVFRSRGRNREMWDGLDQWGNPVAPGTYALKALYHAPLSTEYMATVDNPGNPPWPTPDGKGDWVGDESDPQGVATDGKWVFLASPDAEKGFALIGVDETGQRQWGIPFSPDNPRCVSLAVDGDYLYALYSGPVTTVGSRAFTDKANAIDRAMLMCYDKRTGRAARFTIATPHMQVASVPYREDFHWLADLRNNKAFSPATYGGQPRYACTDVGESTDALGIAVAGGKVYVSLLYDNKIITIDAVTGKPTGEEIPVNAPAGLHALNAGTLLAVSGTQVVKIDLGTKSVSPLITSGLSAPFGVTTDKDGNIYVSDWGSSFQVKAFDSTGKFLHAVGREGGRPWVGKWERDGMLVPRGIAVTGEGKLWVAEDDGSPSRISVWNAGTGDFLKEYIGPTPYGGGTFFAIDPRDPALVHAEGTTFKVDYSKKTYTPLAIDFRRQDRNDPFTPIGHGSAWGHSEIRYHDGYEYFITNVSGGMFSILQRQGDVYRPVAAIGSVRRDLTKRFDGTEIDAFDSDLGGHHQYPGFYPEFFAGHGGDNFSWTDTNGDNSVQSGEMQWVKTVNAPYKEGTQPPFGCAWGGTVLASDWSVITTGAFRDRTVFFRIPLKGWTPAGAPVYDIADAKPFGSIDSVHAGVMGIYATRDDRIIVSHGYENGQNPDAISCYDFTGRQLWAIARPKPWNEPSPLQPKNVHAQNAVYDFTIPKLGDVFGTWLWHGAMRPYLITTDGLYVGTILDYTLLGPKALWGESYTYYYQAPDGTPYVVNGANQAEHILRIHGLEAGSAGRFEGTYRLSEAGARKAAATREVPEEAAPPKPALTVNSMPVSGLNPGAGVTLDGGNGRTADVTLGRDAENLYLFYKVREPDPMRNGGSDWQTLFTSGDCVDLMLQTDPKADPKRRAAGPGDLRLLFSEFQNQPLAVLYRPVAPGSANPVRLSTAQFDEITKLNGARVNISRDAAHGFYTVEACVPLKDLNLDPKTIGNLRGDVGVIFADDSGRSRSLRLYYYNTNTQMVNDLPTEAALQPSEWGAISMPPGHN